MSEDAFLQLLNIKCVHHKKKCGTIIKPATFPEKTVWTCHKLYDIIMENQLFQPEIMEKFMEYIHKFHLAGCSNVQSCATAFVPSGTNTKFVNLLNTFAKTHIFSEKILLSIAKTSAYLNTSYDHCVLNMLQNHPNFQMTSEFMVVRFETRKYNRSFFKKIMKKTVLDSNVIKYMILNSEGKEHLEDIFKLIKKYNGKINSDVLELAVKKYDIYGKSLYKKLCKHGTKITPEVVSVMVSTLSVSKTFKLILKYKCSGDVIQRLCLCCKNKYDRFNKMASVLDKYDGNLHITANTIFEISRRKLPYAESLVSVLMHKIKLTSDEIGWILKESPSINKTIHSMDSIEYFVQHYINAGGKLTHEHIIAVVKNRKRNNRQRALNIILQFGYIPTYEDINIVAEHSCYVPNVEKYNIKFDKLLIEKCVAYGVGQHYDFSAYGYDKNVLELEQLCKIGKMKPIRDFIIIHNVIPSTKAVEYASRHHNKSLIKLLSDKGGIVNYNCFVSIVCASNRKIDFGIIDDAKRIQKAMDKALKAYDLIISQLKDCLQTKTPIPNDFNFDINNTLVKAITKHETSFRKAVDSHNNLAKKYREILEVTLQAFILSYERKVAEKTKMIAELVNDIHLIKEPVNDIHLIKEPVNDIHNNDQNYLEDKVVNQVIDEKPIITLTNNIQYQRKKMPLVANASTLLKCSSATFLEARRLLTQYIHTHKLMCGTIIKPNDALSNALCLQGNIDYSQLDNLTSLCFV